jgi:transcriptional regulator with XRE-family HTH domain
VVKNMTTAKQIKMALTYKDMSEAELAREVGTSPSAFNQRMKTDKFSKDELEKIAVAIGATYTAVFEFPDGTKI